MMIFQPCFLSAHNLVSVSRVEKLRWRLMLMKTKVGTAEFSRSPTLCPHAQTKSRPCPEMFVFLQSQILVK